ncbi:hypothetical protein LL13F56_42790 [Escherichia coli]
MQSQTNIHNVFLFTTINNSITIIEMNDGLYKEYTLPLHPDNMICTLHILTLLNIGSIVDILN